MNSGVFTRLIADARKLIARVSNLPGDLNEWRPEHHDQWLELNRELDQLARGAGSASVLGHDPDGKGEAEFINVLAERLEREQIQEEIEKGKEDARAKLAINAQAQEIKKTLVVQKRENGLFEKGQETEERISQLLASKKEEKAKEEPSPEEKAKTKAHREKLLAELNNRYAVIMNVGGSA